MNRRRYLAIAFGACAAAAAYAQSDNGNDNSSAEFDACGTLIRSEAGCTLFSGGGGQYVLPDYGGFRVGDAVRVVGTLDEACVTICPDADGCIRGAVVYDPAVLPCGTPIDVAFDPCSGLSTGLLALGAVSCVAIRRRHARTRWASNA